LQGAHEFKTKYATLVVTDKTNLDEGTMWPTADALRALDDANEATIIALVKKAVS
jgi:hypothetical protein